MQLIQVKVVLVKIAKVKSIRLILIQSKIVIVGKQYQIRARNRFQFSQNPQFPPS